MDPERFSLYGNTITPAQDRKALEWQQMFIDQIRVRPRRDVRAECPRQPPARAMCSASATSVRDGDGDPIDPDTGVVISTIRMGFGHYRIAMAGASAARAMGYTPYWLDLLAIPGITQDAINWWNTNYSKYSRLSQRSGHVQQVRLGVGHVGRHDTPRDSTGSLNNHAMGWPWRFLKANARDYRKSELFANLHRAMPLRHADSHGHTCGTAWAPWRAA